MIKATIVAAELGLTPGSLLGEAYFVPFGNEVQLIPGYKGLIKLARQSGEVLSISAYVVDESDFFEVELGLEPRVIHRPNLQGRVNRLKAVYAVAKLADGGHAFEFMLPHDIDAIRVRSKGASSGPWKTDYYEMAKKTVLKRLLKLLALSTDKGDALALAVQADYSAETGEIFKTPTVEELNEVIEDVEPALPESPKVSMLAGAIIEAKGSK
jgi:recombination protein RecT